MHAPGPAESLQLPLTSIPQGLCEVSSGGESSSLHLCDPLGRELTEAPLEGIRQLPRPVDTGGDVEERGF